jgi:hypothetical protein
MANPATGKQRQGGGDSGAEKKFQDKVIPGFARLHNGENLPRQLGPIN